MGHPPPAYRNQSAGDGAGHRFEALAPGAGLRFYAV